jgi:ABC-type transport system involved in multi-copper enzyme maturation permease subunit
MVRRNPLADLYWALMFAALGLLVHVAFSADRPTWVIAAWALAGLAAIVPVVINFPSRFWGKLMPPVFRVARATFYEAFRRRFLNGILIFGILIIGSSWVLAYLQPGAELKMLIDIGLGSCRFFGLLIAVFLGTRLIADEMEKRTIYTLLAKPVTRAQFLFGKFLGGYATVFVNVLFMGLAFYLVFAIKAPQFRNLDPESGATTLSMDFMYANIAKAICLTFVELGVLVAIAVAASTVFSWIFASIFTFFLYFVGQMSDFFRQLSDPDRGASKVSQILLGTIYRVLPHFEIFDMREAILRDMLVPVTVLMKHGLQGLLYIVIIMLIAYLCFNEREV